MSRAASFTHGGFSPALDIAPFAAACRVFILCVWLKGGMGLSGLKQSGVRKHKGPAAQTSESERAQAHVKCIIPKPFVGWS